MTLMTRRRFVAATLATGALALAPLTAAEASIPPPEGGAKTTISITYQAQQASNWCAPASTRIALSASGRLPTQANLANALGVGSAGGSGLQDPYAIARVLNNRLGISDRLHKYVLSQDMNAFDNHVIKAVAADMPVVYNVIKVGNQTYTGSGHYIAITGRRTTSSGTVQYRIADPDSAARTGNWYSRATVKSWNKWGRHTTYL